MKNLFKVGISFASDKQKHNNSSYFLEWDPDSGSDITILSRAEFQKIQRHFCKSITLSQTFATFTTANNSAMHFDGYFNAIFTTISGATCKSKIFVSNLPPDEPPLLGENELLALGLIKYFPEGRQIRKVQKQAESKSNPLPKIELTDKKYVETFEALHKEYGNVFQGMGLLKNYECELHLTEDIEFFYRPALVPVHLQDRASERLREYISQGLFEWVPSGTPIKYSSSLLVIEEGEKLRLVGDYRHLNKFIQKVSTTTSPRIETFLDRMQGSRYFIKTDMSRGYWQIALSEKSRDICTLSTHLGNVRPTRVPMGIRISGNIFDQKVAAILNDCRHTCHNRDDILIGCETIEQLISEWRKVLKAFSASGFTLDPMKTFVGLTEIEWHGYLFTSLGAAPSPKKVAALRSAPRPISQEGLLSFICTVSFNSRFILRFSEYAQCLRILANTKGIFDWTNEHEKAFQYLKISLCENTLNNHFIKSRRTAVFCDAGKKAHVTNTPGALSGILAQLDENSEEESWLPIQFASRVLTDTETRYGQSELEALAIRFSLTRFSYYVQGARNIIVFTDCSCLVAMFNRVVKTTPPRILRMILAVQEIDFTVVYRKGKANISDFLSRNPPPPDLNSAEELLDLTLSDDLERAVVRRVQEHHAPITMQTIREATVNSPDLQFLLDVIRKGTHKQHKKDPRIKPYRDKIPYMSEISDIIYVGDDIIVIPESLSATVTHVLHELGHQGTHNTLQLIKSHFFYVNMNSQVESVTKTCELCQQTNISKRKEPYGLRPVPQQPFSEVSVDHKSLDNGYYCLVILDIHSRYPDVAFVKSTSFEANKEPLLKYFSYFQTPLIIRSDNGSPWNSVKFKEFSQIQGFKHDLVTPRSPIANSEVERVMYTISKAYSRSKILKNGLWRESILDAIKAKRCTPHPAFGMSPYEVIFGRKMRPGAILVAPWIKERPQDSAKRFQSIEQKLFQDKQTRQEKFSKQRNVRPHDFRVGDRCWYVDRTKFKVKNYEPDLHQVVKVAGTQITAKSLETGRIVVRNSTFFKHFVDPISPPELKNEQKYDDENENRCEDEHIVLDEPTPEVLPPRVGNPVNRERPMPNEAAGNNRAMPEGQNNRVAEQGRNAVEAERAPAERNDRLEPRQTRSRGPAPNIPHVLPSAPERSAQLREELRQIHNAHENRIRDED